MAVSAGTVVVNATTGVVTGSGHARSLYAAEALGHAEGAALLEGTLAAYWSAIGASAADQAQHGPSIIAFRQRTAAKCTSLAAAHVALILTATVTVIVPSTPITVTNGTVS